MPLMFNNIQNQCDIFLRVGVMSQVAYTHRISIIIEGVLFKISTGYRNFCLIVLFARCL